MKHKHKKAFIGTTFISVSLGAVPMATVAGEASPTVLDKIMVIGNPGNIDEFPGAAHLVSREEISQQNYDDINQALRKVPGVYIRQEEGFGLFPNISLRGVDTTRSAKVTLMEDGVLTAPAPYSAPAAYYSPTVGRMSGIEVLKGSSQVKYGPHTTGGVINYLATAIPTRRTTYLKTSFGRFGDQRTHAYVGDTLETRQGRVGVLIEGYYRRNQGYKTIDETPDFRDGDETGFSKLDPMVKLAWEPDTAIYQRLEFKYGSSELDANETYLGLSEADYQADPFRRYAASRFDNIQSKQTRSYLRYTVAPNDDLDVVATLYRNTFTRNWYKLKDLRNVNGNTLDLSNALAGAQNGEGLACLKGELACTLRIRANNRDYEAEGLDLAGYYRFTTGGAAHEIAAGVRYHQDQVVRFQWDDDYSQLANGAIDAMTAGTPGGAGDWLQKTRALAVYLQDTIEMGDWRLIPGVRAERLEQTYINNYAGVSGAPDQKTNTMTLWGGSLGLTYALSDRWTAFGSLNRGYSPPNPKSATGGIREETSLAYELGARYANTSQALVVEAVAFRTDFRDMIAIDNMGGTGTGTATNFGKVRSYGLELSSQYDAGIANGWGLRNPWFFSATYTNATQRNDATSTDPESIFSFGRAGNKVPYIPEWVLTAGTGIATARWGGEISGSYVSETFTTANNVRDQLNGENPRQPDARFGVTDAYLVIDAVAHYRMNKNAKLFAGVQNLTDRRYLVSRQPEGPRPGMPLFAYAGVEVRL